MSIPSASELVQEADHILPSGNINAIHGRTYELMINYRIIYYERKVEAFLSQLNLDSELHARIKKKMLEPIVAGGVEYSNFMEEASRRVSQTFQVISGNIAELCVERELMKAGLQRKIHYKRKIERTDIIIYSPNFQNQRARHRIEVKNVKLRERGTRGLAFDGDSLIGFFDDPGEFTESNVQVIDEYCTKTGGYCYLPPATLEGIRAAGSRFRSNTQFGSDALHYIRNGRFPASTQVSRNPRYTQTSFPE
jgi:hypothetical protein